MKRIGTILPAILREMTQNEKTALVFIQELWPQMVGKDLSQKVFPASLESRTLTLDVCDGTWNAQLTHFRPLLRESINSFWEQNLVEQIEFRLRPQR